MAPGPAAPATRPGRAAVLATLAVALVTAVALAPAQTGDFVWDDTALIPGNRALALGAPDYFASPFFPEGTSVGHLYGAIVRPVVKASHFALWHVFGPAPLAFHLTNVVLHLACVALACRWLARRVPGAGAAALAAGLVLFALHPSRVESVAWISGSPDLWMALFVLLAAEAAERPGRGGALAAGGSTALAALAKEPALAAALCLFRDERARGRRAAARAVLAGAAVAALVLAGLMLANDAPGGAALASQPWWAPLAALGHQAGYVLWPWRPAFHNPIAGFEGAELVVPVPAIAAGALVVAGVLALVLRDRARGAATGLGSDALWFLLPLAPALFAPAWSPRFLYLPLLGVAAMLVRGLTRVERAQMPLRIGVAAAALALGAVLFAESRSFRDASSLWRVQYARQPENPLVLDNHGKALEAAGEYAEAKRVFAEGVRHSRAPEYARKHLHLALHVMRLEALRPSEAEQDELRALVRGYEGLEREGRLELDLEGVRVSRSFAAADVAAELGSAHLHAFPRAVALARAGELERAASMLRGVVSASPTYAPAWTTLVLVEARRFELERAAAALTAARPHLPPPTVESMAALLDRVRSIAAGTAASPPARAQALLLLGAPQLAREALRGVDSTDPQIVQLRMQIELRDARPAEAARILETAAAENPGAPEWAQLRRVLAGAAGPAGG